MEEKKKRLEKSEIREKMKRGEEVRDEESPGVTRGVRTKGGT